MRIGIRRFKWLTNAFSKKVEDDAAAVAIHFMHYTFAQPQTSLKNPYARTPAMAAGVADHVWTPGRDRRTGQLTKLVCIAHRRLASLAELAKDDRGQP